MLSCCGLYVALLFGGHPEVDLASGHAARRTIGLREEAIMAKKLRCYLRQHRWVRRVQANQAYYECRNCGKTRDPQALTSSFMGPTS
jgi:hypothetical protein